MAPGFPLCVNAVNFRTSEALYQACRYPHLPELQRKIIKQRSPITAKMLIKPYKDKSRPDWLAVRIKVMRWCLRIKLAQNFQKFSELLLATGDKPIVELSNKDDFWGANYKEGNLVGNNILGRLLMELREKILLTDFEKLRIVEPISIPKFSIYGKSIEVIFGNSNSANPCSKLNTIKTKQVEPCQLCLFNSGDF